MRSDRYWYWRGMRLKWLYRLFLLAAYAFLAIATRIVVVCWLEGRQPGSEALWPMLASLMGVVGASWFFTVRRLDALTRRLDELTK